VHARQQPRHGHDSLLRRVQTGRRRVARTRSRPQFHPNRVGARPHFGFAPQDCSQVQRHGRGGRAGWEFGLRRRARRADAHARRGRDRLESAGSARHDAHCGRLAVEQRAGAAVRADAPGGRRLWVRFDDAPRRRGTLVFGGRVAQGRLRLCQQTGRPRGVVVGQFLDECARGRDGSVGGAARAVPGCGADRSVRHGVDLCFGAAGDEKGRFHQRNRGGQYYQQQQAVAFSAVSIAARQGHGGGETGRAGSQVQGEHGGEGWCVGVHDCVVLLLSLFVFSTFIDSDFFTDAGRCTHLAWLPSDPAHPALHLLAVGFENGFAVFHVELPILADGNKSIPEPTQSTVVSATPSLGPIAVKRWLGAVECTFVSWLGLGPHVDPLIAVLMIDATSASVLLCAMNIPSYSQSLVAKANVLTCRILTVKEVPKGSNSFPGGLLQSCSARKALVCFTEQRLSTISLVAPSTKGLSPVATLDFPITSIPPGLSSFGAPFLVDAKSDKDGILHMFSTVHCERYKSKSDASMLPWSAPMRRTWLCRSVAGDTKETFVVEETKEERGFGDTEEASGGASADVICELNDGALRGMAPTRIVRCIGSNVCAVLFRPAFASARSGKALALVEADTIALVNFQETSPVINITKGRDIVFFPSEEEDSKSARGLILSADGASLTFFNWTSGTDCELSTSFRPIVGVDSDKDYIESKRIDLFVDGTKLSLGVLGKRKKKYCFVTGDICDFADATSEAWFKLLPNIVSGRSSWIEEGEEILSIVGLQGDGSGYRNFALATSSRVLILSSALTVAAETRRRVSCANLAPIGNFAVAFSSEDKVRYLCCLDGDFVESGIATLSDKSYNAVLAVRPDRLLLSPTQACTCLVEPGRSPNSFIMPAPNTRVALMLEALVANAICVGGKQNQSTPVLRTVIEKFGRKGGSLTHGEKEGIGQYGAGLTSKTFAMLDTYGLKHSASWLLTGVPKFERSVNCEILPAWLPVSAKSKGAMNTDAMLQVLSNGDSYLLEYVKSPEQNMPAPLPRQSDITASLSAEYGQAALASGKGLDALKMFDLSGSESTESSLLLLSLLLEKKNGGSGSAGILESISGLRESAFSRSSKMEKIPASLAALALSLKKAQGSSDFSMTKDEIDRFMKPLAPSLQRSRTSGRPRQRLLFEKDLESAASSDKTQDLDSFWATPCNESKHVWYVVFVLHKVFVLFLVHFLT